MPTVALLICMKNTFWSIERGGNFVELFKKSFKLYVESGTREKMEAAINSILIDEQGGRLVTNSEDFKGKFYMLITEHYLRKIHFLFICT